MITVVIPFFQREPGVLGKALRSVAAQIGCPEPIHVLVVDDASPVPAADELAGWTPPPGVVVQVLRQPNAGPGGARNRGLDAVPAATRWLAFLDSDDEWSPQHLAHAVKALEAGHDFYFADLLQLGQSVGAFKRAGRLDLARHRALPEVGPWAHGYVGDFFDQILRGNLVGTSTVVYRWTEFGDKRFRVDLTSAGEDYLFWMALAVRGARVVFSTDIEATYGRGVNVYSGSGWGTEGHLRRVHDEIAFRRLLPSSFPLSPPQRQHVRAGLVQLRLAFTRDLLHRLSHRKPLPWALLLRHAGVDPFSYLGMPLSAIRVLLGRA